MTEHDASHASRIETRSLTASMFGNLFMGAAGVVAALLTNSQAILVDGLFSLIGFIAAILGKRVARNASRLPDRYRPFGYAGDEAIFTTFRSLSLLGLVVFAIANALITITGYVRNGTAPDLVFAPMAIYFILIGITCTLLFAFHRRSWVRSGRKSDILRLEAKAMAFDGLITAAAAAGLFAIQIFGDGFLAPIAPIGDSIVVLVLCGAVISRYVKDFMSGLAELAGVTAAPKRLAEVRRSVRNMLASRGGRLIDLSVTKLGRAFTVVVYYDPETAVTAHDIDSLTTDLRAELRATTADVEVFLMVSQHGRVLPLPDPKTVEDKI